MTAFRCGSTKIGFVSVLLPLLLINAFHGIQPLPSSVLSAQDLAGLLGAGFWTDPCTWDGFGAGITLVMCGAGNMGACGGSVLAIWRAVKLDNCF